ncbi:hypothetical protein EJP67_02235 [Variovorax guangxiensis]|uniref:Uncharacterized protein n=1 Tax=Variovorax guangxiensis TaxID=1775474 RepID=A0A433MDN8_9BURK|nr:hypothetical protein [Variovorax guangxiensis]RUR65872.1 hypothetical protein EJP67_02235 [Variovorax guangxiensis]
MEALLDELRTLEKRANALLALDVDVENKLVEEDRGKAEYKALKDGIAARLKEFERRPPAGAEDWVISTFAAALRAAHIGMRAPTNASPWNSSWRSSVHELADELSYYAATLAKGLSVQTGRV